MTECCNLCGIVFQEEHYFLMCCKFYCCEDCLWDIKDNDKFCINCGVKIYFIKTIPFDSPSTNPVSQNSAPEVESQSQNQSTVE